MSSASARAALATETALLAAAAEPAAEAEAAARRRGGALLGSLLGPVVVLGVARRGRALLGAGLLLVATRFPLRLALALALLGAAAALLPTLRTLLLGLGRDDYVAAGFGRDLLLDQLLDGAEQGLSS